MSAKTDNFLKQYADDIVSATAGTGLFPSVVIAQAALETGWGDSVKRAANNMFGIKGTNWKGKVISLNTTEYIGGVKKAVAGTGKIYGSYDQAVADGANRYTIFRVYGSVRESINDHNKLITSSSRYKPVMEATTPEGQARALQNCGYAGESTSYATALINLIKQYNLTEYDKKKKLRSADDYRLG
jgi:flagellum-specific peptidoglycan hydrolase FlgJ